MRVDSSFPQTSVIHTMITNRETVRFTVATLLLGSHSSMFPPILVSVWYQEVTNPHFKHPKIYESNMIRQHRIPLQAGDVIVCSTNLLHDASPWTEDYPRMNIFQRYQLSVYFNETGKEGYPLEEYRHQISAEQYELESLSKEEKVAVYRASIGSSA